MDQILSLILLLGAIQGGILSIILFLSKFNRTANKVLASAIFIVSVALLFAYFQVVLDYRAYSFQIKSGVLFPLIFIPLIYIYTKINTKDSNRLSLLDLNYFIPFVGIFIYNISFYFGKSSQKVAYYVRENITNSALLRDQIEIIAMSFIIFIFAIAIVSLVLKMRKNFENQVSNYREELITLMFFLGWATLAFTFTGFILSILEIAGINYPSFLDFITAIGSSVLIYFIGYYSLLHPQIFHPLKEVIENIPSKITPRSNEDLYDDYLVKIILFMEQKKLYQNADLSLQDFSKTLNIPSYLVSKIINSKTGLNFYNFVNKYRIEEVKQALLDNESPQILQIAFAAGFNTKSSFYNYFKKHTGQSPKDFIKKSI